MTLDLLVYSQFVNGKSTRLSRIETIVLSQFSSGSLMLIFLANIVFFYIIYTTDHKFEQ